MTTYTFVPTASTQYVNWNNASIWSGGVVPNDPGADVVIPETTYLNNGSPYVSFITVSSTYTVKSLSIADNFLEINSGSLTVNGAVGLGSGSGIDLGIGGPAGSLSAGSINNNGGEIQGKGTVDCLGFLLNQGAIIGDGLSVSAASLDNTGMLQAATGDLTVTVTPGGFANLSGTTLSGGAYDAGFGGSTLATLYLNVGGVVNTIAANVTLYGNGEIDFYDSSKSAYVPIESSLQTIAAGGTLMLANGTDTFSSVTVDGLLLLVGGRPTFTQLTVDPQGTTMGIGAIYGSIVDNGTIAAGLAPAENSAGIAGGKLDIAGLVTGGGSLVIEPGKLVGPVSAGAPATYAGWTLELGSPNAMDVAFMDGTGTLILDNPTTYTGAIKPVGAGDVIQLENVSLSSVVSYSYSGDRSGGTLVLNLGGTEIDLSFTGDFSARSFSLTAGPQVLSTDPQNVLVTVNGPATPLPDLIRDHFDGGAVSEILIENSKGQLVVGHVAAGQETYAVVGGLGPEWTFRGVGDFLGDNKSDFLIQNTNGALCLGEMQNGAAVYTHIATLGAGSTFVGTGDFLGGAQDQFLIETSSGQVELGSVQNGAASLSQVGALGSEWTIVGAGAYLGDGRTQFLMENATNGVVMIGEVQNGQVHYTQAAVLGPEWKFVGSGDFLGDGRNQFLIENANGSVVAADIGQNGQVRYTTLTGLGSEWKFVGTGDYLGEGHDQFMIENSNGAVVIGDYFSNHVHFTRVGGLGADWAFHG